MVIREEERGEGREKPLILLPIVNKYRKRGR